MSRKLFHFVWIAIAFVASASTACAQTGTMPVYNVLDYINAHAPGTTDITAALNSYATSAGAAGGIIYVPAGTWDVTGAVSIGNMQWITLRGDGSKSSNIVVHSAGSITVTTAPGAGSGPYHNGSIEGLEISCSTGETGPSSGLTTVDMKALKVHNVSFSNCHTGVDMQNVNGFSERNDFDNVTFYNNAIAVHFDRLSTVDATASYGYNTFRIWIGTDQVSKVFSATGGADPYNSFFTVQGNIAFGTVVFSGPTDSGGSNGFSSDMFNVRLESTDTGSGTSYVFDGTGGSQFNGTANLDLDPTSISVVSPGTTSWPLSFSNTAPTNFGTIIVGGGTGTPNQPGTPGTVTTALSSTQDKIVSGRLTDRSVCFVQPAGGNAAGLTNVYIDGYSASGSAVLHHSAGVGTFWLWCGYH